MDYSASGCDIVFACAGGSGLGVFQWSKRMTDMLSYRGESNSNAPNHIIASGLRLWDAAMADVGKRRYEGILDSGTLTYGIQKNTLKVDLRK